MSEAGNIVLRWIDEVTDAAEDGLDSETKSCYREALQKVIAYCQAVRATIECSDH